MKDPVCSAREAVDRAHLMVVERRGEYRLGTGDYLPSGPGSDIPWTAGKYSDCAGFAICYCWKLKRHRPGFNKGDWSTVEDDLNVNSVMEDASHNKELAAYEVDRLAPVPGDLLCYPTFKVAGKTFIGHVALIDVVPTYYKPGRYDQLQVVQCHGPNGFTPGAVHTDGSLFLHHDAIWPLPKHQCKIIRMKERP